MHIHIQKYDIHSRLIMSRAPETASNVTERSLQFIDTSRTTVDIRNCKAGNYARSVKPGGVSRLMASITSEGYKRVQDVGEHEKKRDSEKTQIQWESIPRDQATDKKTDRERASIQQDDTQPTIIEYVFIGIDHQCTWLWRWYVQCHRRHAPCFKPAAITTGKTYGHWLRTCEYPCMRAHVYRFIGRLISPSQLWNCSIMIIIFNIVLLVLYRTR